MSAPSPSWYLRRLRAMSPAEVGHRGRAAARQLAWSRRQVRPGEMAPAPADLRSERPAPAELPAGAADLIEATAAARLLAAADAVLAGRWTTFGAVRADSADPDWFADPVTGRRAPQQTPAFRVQHRDEGAVGNVKQIWELSRHHHLTVLAAAYWLSGEERYAEACAHQLRSWWRANPFLSGIHWTSGIEVGIRLISWVWIRRLLADWPKVGDLFEGAHDAQCQIAWHQEYLAAFPSRGSSANNHLVAEAAGALAAACAFDWYGRTPQWRVRAAAELERSLAANTFPSGLNRELATEYHAFVADLALLAATEADAAGHPLGEGTWQRIAAMLDAAAAVVDTAGRPPRQGDGDEGRALLVDDPGAQAWGLTLSGGHAVLGSPQWWPATAPSVRAALLRALSRSGPTVRAGQPEGTERRIVRAAAPARVFPDAGLVLLRSRPQDGPEIWCRCDGGPHGFGSIAGHAHADALAIEVRHGGVDLFADPGTYCYHGEPEWRQHFRATAAHNTVQLAGVDSSVSGGPFLWTRHARASTRSVEVGEVPRQSWQADHDGYRRLDTPAGHRRRVTLDSPGRTLHIEDTIEADAPLTAQLTWQLGPRVEARLDGNRAVLSWPGGRAELILPEDLTWTAHRGETAPIRGWYSPHFGERVPATALIGTGTSGPAAPLVTELRVLDRGDDGGEGGRS